MPKLSLTSGRCPWWLIFFRSLFYQNNCKEAMNRGGVPFVTFLLWKNAFSVSFGCIYNRFIMSCHDQVCLIKFNERYYFERYFFHHWASAVGGWTSNQIFKKRGGLDRTSTFKWGCWKRGEWLFSGGLQFTHKNKLKSEIFNDEKNYM